jgi:PAS domain S-box-containing protein
MSDDAETLPHDVDLHRSIIAHMVEGVAYCRMLFDDEGRPVDYINVDVNPAFVELTGLRDAVGRRITEAIPGIREANPELFDIYGRVTRTDIPEQFETYVPGLARWYSVRAFRPRPEHFAAVFENITERKLGEQALRASEARMRGALDAMHDPFLVCTSIRSADGTITGFRAVFANRAAEAFMGRMPDTLSGSPMPERMPFLGTAPFFETFRDVVETGEPWSKDGVEFRVPGRDGTTSTGAIDIQVAKFEDGFFATWRDVTERTASAEALHQSEHRFRQFFERTPDHVYMVSIDGRLIDANPAALEALGYAHDDLVGKPIKTIYAPESRVHLAELFERWAETGPITNLEQVLLTREGERRSVLLSASIVRHAGGRPPYFLGVQRDITELREAQADADLELRVSAFSPRASSPFPTERASRRPRRRSATGSPRSPSSTPRRCRRSSGLAISRTSRRAPRPGTRFRWARSCPRFARRSCASGQPSDPGRSTCPRIRPTAGCRGRSRAGSRHLPSGRSATAITWRACLRWGPSTSASHAPSWKRCRASSRSAPPSARSSPNG